MKTLKSDFMDILENQRIKPVFQPIISLNSGEIIGYEALSRIINPQEISYSEELFHLAGFYGKVWELEQLCRRKALEKYYGFHVTDHKKLFINVSPLVIHDNGFRAGFTREYLRQYGLDLKDIVFEVTERDAIDDVKGYKDTIRHYKSQGYNIAVDDAGSCYSGLNLICDIVPHYLKLDISLIHDIYKDAIKYAMVKSLVEFANLTHIELVAEGIECEEELKTLIKLGVHNGQGFFLKTPDEELKGVDKTVVELIHKYNDKKAARMKKYNSGTKEFRAVLFTFENYKAYNAYCEKYGDEKGDKIIEEMNSIIVQNLSENETAIFLEEDKLLTILEKQSYKMKCELVASVFKNRMHDYYQIKDMKKGYIAGRDKNGEKKKYPIINIRSEIVV